MSSNNKRARLSHVLDTEWFPMCDGKPLSPEASDCNRDVLKNAFGNACSEINRCVFALQHSNAETDTNITKETLLDEFEVIRNRRNEILSQLEDASIEVELDISGWKIVNFIFKDIEKSDDALAPDSKGHSFDITIPIFQDEEKMEKHLRTQLAPLFGGNRSTSQEVDESNADT